MSRRFPLSPPVGLPSRFFDDFRDLDLERHFMRPYWNDVPIVNAQKFGEGSGEIVDNDENFSITLDVSHFAPEELKVNIDDGVLVVEGKHDVKNDKYGQIERHFVRRLQLPKGTKPETVTSELTKEGMLTVQTPKNVKEPVKSRNIPIFRKD